MIMVNCLSTEYGVDEVAKALDLNPNRFCLLASLLGNHILPTYELSEFHNRLAPPTAEQPPPAPSGGTAKPPNSYDRVIKAVINYIRALPTVDDYDVIAKDVFGADQADPRVSCLKESVKYYLQGTKEGYTKHFANPAEKVKKSKGGNNKETGTEHTKLAGRVITDGSIRLPADQHAEEQARRQQIKQLRKSSSAAAAAEGSSAAAGKRSQAEIAERIGEKRLL